MKALFVINPISGGKNKSSFINLISKLFTQYQYTYYIFYTSKDKEKDIYELKQIYHAFKPTRIYAVGGDGTLIFIINVFFKYKIPLVLIPFGSANGMARELGMPLFPETALKRSLESCEARNIDLLQVNDIFYCLHIGDIGMNAHIIDNFNADSKNRGFLGYAKYLWDAIRNTKIIKFRIDANGKNYFSKGYMLAIANAKKYGTGVVINPSGEIDDGQFELVTLCRIGLGTLISIISSIWARESINDYIQVIRCGEATIRLKKEELLQLDGEIIGNFKDINVKILPQAVRILIV